MKSAVVLALCVSSILAAEINLGSWRSRTTLARCGSDEFRCTSGKCIKNTWVCDGDKDCDGGEDERSCRGGTTPSGRGRTPEESCSSREFDCGVGNGGQYGRCIPNTKLFMCDGVKDCLNGADERNCVGTTTPSYREMDENCKPGEFKCRSGRCIKRQWVCDGADDCSDGDDEKNCRGGATTTRATTRGRSWLGWFDNKAKETGTTGTKKVLAPMHIVGLKVEADRGSRLWSRSATTKEECSALCNSRVNYKCRLTQFDKVRKMCTAFPEDVEAKFVYNEDYSAYGRWNETATRYQGMNYRGNDITYEGESITEWMKISWSEQICTEICHIHPKCDLAVYNTKTNKCALKELREGATRDGTRDPNSVSVVLGEVNPSSP